MSINRKKTKGFLLIEVIVGVSILAFCLLGIISVGQGFLRLSFQSFQGSQANFLLEEGAEVARALRDTSWNNISGLTAGTKYYLEYDNGLNTWATTTAVSQIDHVFYRYITVSDVNRDDATGDILTSGGTLDEGTRKITVNVSWLASTGTSTKTAMVYLADI
ncbi:MAG: prepilin-type N-terminal cleavage/methylation domain-containing protein [Candidatus Paceibacterota bacterium]|jgi:Tfp pilus assembly protein PilV|nr:prepilin-type N-terminal cleavage/methylation domain-containing protein [Candidatus Paceibacterota bacterium]